MFIDGAEISFGNRTSENNLAVRIQVLRCLAEEEAERIAINAAACIRCIIDELYLSAVECSVFPGVMDS